VKHRAPCPSCARIVDVAPLHADRRPDESTAHARYQERQAIASLMFEVCHHERPTGTGACSGVGLFVPRHVVSTTVGAVASVRLPDGRDIVIEVEPHSSGAGWMYRLTASDSPAIQAGTVGGSTDVVALLIASIIRYGLNQVTR